MPQGRIELLLGGGSGRDVAFPAYPAWSYSQSDIPKIDQTLQEDTVPRFESQSAKNA